MIQGIYFDGRNARKHHVRIDLEGGAIGVISALGTQRYAAAQARMAEPFQHAPCVIDFDDGARLEVADLAAYPALTAAVGYRVSRIERWQQNAISALAAVLLMVAVLAGGVQWGVPALAERIVPTLPVSLDQELGDAAFAKMQQGIEPSGMNDERVAEIHAIFQRVAPARTRMPLKFHVIRAPRFGANAFALPNGVIVMTDAMVRHVTGDAEELNDHMRAQLAGIMVHEIGHVEGRHSMRALTRGSLMALGSAALFGDFSGIAASAPALLLNLDYAREMEREADRYAIARLHALGMSTDPLADLFASLAQAAGPASKVPRWMAQTRAYVSSHPADAERIAAFRRGHVQP